MGFGILFIGLTLLFVMSGYAVLPACIGYFICVYACLKLTEFDDRFKLPAVSFGILGTLSLARSALQLTLLLSGNTVLEDLLGETQIVSELFFYLGQFLLLPALIAITTQTGRRKTAFACRRNAVIFLLMFVLYIVANLLLKNGWRYAAVATVYAVASRFLVLLLNMISVFSCYMWICEEGQEEAEEESALNRRVTRFFRKNEPEEAKEEEPKWIRDRNRKKRRKG